MKHLVALFVAVCTVLGLLAAQASARPILTYSDGSPAVAESKVVKRFYVPSSTYSITVHREMCEGGGLDCVGSNAECVDAQCSSLRWISHDIYLHPTGRGLGFDPYSLRHELGHFFDQEFLDDAERARFAALIGMSGIAWLTGASGDGPGEAFADAYARAAKFGPRPPKGAFGNGAYGFELTRHNARKIVRFIRAAARTPAA